MHMLTIQLLTTLAAAFAPVGEERIERAEARLAPAAKELTVAVKLTDPVRVAYLEQVGPYWMVGPAFRRVGQYMREHGQAGPIFARYLENPASVPPGSLRSEIGFVIEGDLQPKAPFKVSRRNPERVAYAVVEGPYARTRRHHATMYAWIEANGHKPVGPITEVYPLPLPSATGPTEQRTEIQIVLEGPKSQSQDLCGTGFPTGQSADKTSSPAGSKPISVEGEPPKPLKRIEPSPPPSPGRERADHAVSSTGAATSTETSAASAAQVSHPATGPAGKPVPQTLEEEPTLAIKELIAASRFERIAEQLMPDERAIPDDLQVWFGQMVFLIGAAAKGIERTCPGNEQTVTAIAEAIARRYRAVSAGFTLQPVDQVVIRVDPRGDPLAGRKKAIMRNLHRLLAGIASKTVDADGAAEQLGEVLQAMHDLIREQSK